MQNGVSIDTISPDLRILSAQNSETCVQYRQNVYFENWHGLNVSMDSNFVIPPFLLLLKQNSVVYQ